MQNGKNRPYCTRMKSLVPQQEYVQVVAHSILTPGSLPQIQTSSASDQTIQSSPPSFAQMQTTEPMEVRLPNEPPPSILNQNSTTEQQLTSSKHILHLGPEGRKFTS